MIAKTVVLPTSRAIREALSSESFDIFKTPKYITIGEFFKKLVVVPNLSSIDEDSATLMLLEASDFKNFKHLKIERNFFTFTKNSAYIFDLFGELSTELYDIEKLLEFDVYAEYEEHIAILSELLKKYEELCAKRGVLDKIFLPKNYKFNEAGAKEFGEIELYLEGYLTNFELELLKKCSSITKVILHFNSTKFNQKMREKLSEFDLEVGFAYKLDMSELKVLEKTPLSRGKNITAYELSSPLLEVAFAKLKVYEFIKKGFNPSKIVVILPDESKASQLRAFSKNFNFAMGLSFEKTLLYQKLQAAKLYLDDESIKNKQRVKRLDVSFVDELRAIYYLPLKQSNFLEILKSFECEEDKKLYLHELHKFELFCKDIPSLNVKLALTLFLMRLAKLSIDEVGGGAITVMGLLESRMVEFDGVIVLDFDGANVPKKSDKDMFLNTHIREAASLPTSLDRQNLQKYYYDRLFSRAKEVAICYVKSEKDGGSRFLDELNIATKNIDEESLLNTLCEPKVPDEPKEDEQIIMRYDFSKVELSSSKLKTFLECKRKYYYRHIKNLTSHELETQEIQAKDIGNKLHLILKNLYLEHSSYKDEQSLRAELLKQISLVGAKNLIEEYQLELYKKTLESFCALEVQRFQEGYRVLSVENFYKSEFEGIKIVGFIDRVDELDGELIVLDYKSGSYNLYTQKSLQNATDFQLEFYYILASSVGKVKECAFYDLKDMKIVSEDFFEQKLTRLREIIKELVSTKEFDFTKCEELKYCRFCEYAKICGRE